MYWVNRQSPKGIRKNDLKILYFSSNHFLFINVNCTFYSQYIIFVIFLLTLEKYACFHAYIYSEHNAYCYVVNVHQYKGMFIYRWLIQKIKYISSGLILCLCILPDSLYYISPAMVNTLSPIDMRNSYVAWPHRTFCKLSFLCTNTRVIPIHLYLSLGSNIPWTHSAKYSASHVNQSPTEL